MVDYCYTNSRVAGKAVVFSIYKEMTFALIWITMCAFLLGVLPFSLWVGYLAAHKDIRCYGDGNPGAANVFRAGSPKAGMAAVLLDVFKGVPVVYLAARDSRLSENQLLFIAFAAILGHAFTPLLRFCGGKAVVVTFGVLVGLMRWELLVPFAVAAIVGLFIFENHSWVVLCAPIFTLAHAFINDAGLGVFVFMACILLLYLIKHARDLAGWPRPRKWLYN